MYWSVILKSTILPYNVCKVIISLKNLPFKDWKYSRTLNLKIRHPRTVSKLQTHKVSLFFLIHALDWWTEEKWSIEGCMNFIFFSFWVLYEARNSIYKMMPLGSEQRKQLILILIPANFCLLPSSKYNWMNSDCSCIRINAYMQKK